MTSKENEQNPEYEKVRVPEEDILKAEPEAQKDYREDSILYRPRTETYETHKDDNTFESIKKHNPFHAIEEKRRDELNRNKRISKTFKLNKL